MAARIPTRAFERAALAAATAAAACLAAGPLAGAVPSAVWAAGRAAPPVAPARDRLVAARAILAEDGPAAAGRFDAMVGSVAAGIPADTPPELGPWLAQIRRSRAEEGPGGGTAVTRSVEDALRVLERVERDRAAAEHGAGALGRALADFAPVLLLLAALCAAVPVLRGRAHRRRLGELVGAAFDAPERELEARVALALVSSRRDRARAEPPAAPPSDVASTGGLERPRPVMPAVPRPRSAGSPRRLADVAPLSDEWERGECP